MTDLISRTNAIELVKEVCDAIMSGCKSHYDSEIGDEVYDDILEVDAILKCNKEIRKALKAMPSAQPEIIHCGNCKYWEGFKKNGFWYFEQCSIIERTTSSDDFCSWAERREDGKTN